MNVLSIWFHVFPLEKLTGFRFQTVEDVFQYFLLSEDQVRIIWKKRDLKIQISPTLKKITKLIRGEKEKNG